MSDVRLRHAEPEDHQQIIAVLDEWWESDTSVEGVPVTVDYDGVGEDRVVFSRTLPGRGLT